MTALSAAELAAWRCDAEAVVAVETPGTPGAGGTTPETATGQPDRDCALVKTRPDTAVSPDDIARQLGLHLPRRNTQRATAYTDLLQPAADAYWQHRHIPEPRKATE